MAHHLSRLSVCAVTEKNNEKLGFSVDNNAISTILRVRFSAYCIVEVNVSQRSDSIAAGLRAQRAIKNVSQREATKAIGANQSTLSGWENNAGIGLEDAWAAADYYGCSLDDLAGRPWPPREG